ncbi:hypothetical protein N7492_001650 [Penicillium capsulatum]|uniref:Sodium/calcium exchanger membrane region domain-containing protein n=1 Tax=Penicillium capsulatum TaxID=69766 RepID=A0A9W9IS44_9EURO|nr:hypothetical protein N7492_001650 [Penicillium capsulatum]KAJ6129297.1 hypothetical protein N7512_002077 [Penicillium capsulatum]
MSTSSDGDSHDEPQRLRSARTFVIAARTNRNLNIASIVVPVLAVVIGETQLPDALVFAVNLAGASFLVRWIVQSVEALSTSTGRLFGELLKGTLGHSVELLIGINAVFLERPHLSRAIMLGSIICNLLLVLGSSLFYAGYDKNRLRFDRTLTTILSSIMMVVFIILIIPTAMEALSLHHTKATGNTIVTQRISAIILVGLLLTYLLFRLRTHVDIFAGTPFHNADQEDASSSTMTPQLPHPIVGRRRAVLTLLVASICMLGCTVNLVQTIPSTAKLLGTSQAFLGVTLIPVAGNFTKYRRVVLGSRSNAEVERGIRAVIHSVLRITMIIAPLLVLIGWIGNQPLVLRFDQFEATTLLLSIVVMTYLIADGCSNYFEGLMLIGTYAITAFAFYVRPEPHDNAASMRS